MLKATPTHSILHLLLMKVNTHMRRRLMRITIWRQSKTEEMKILKVALTVRATESDYG